VHQLDIKVLYITVVICYILASFKLCELPDSARVICPNM